MYVHMYKKKNKLTNLVATISILLSNELLTHVFISIKPVTMVIGLPNMYGTSLKY